MFESVRYVGPDKTILICLSGDDNVTRSDMSISVHCRSRRDLEIRDLGNFFRVFLGNSTITVVRFNAKSTLNTNGIGSSGNNNTWSISTSTYSGSYNTWSISTSTLQWQLQYMVNINLDLQCTMSQQVYTRPKNNFSKIAANGLKIASNRLKIVGTQSCP